MLCILFVNVRKLRSGEGGRGRGEVACALGWRYTKKLHSEYPYLCHGRACMRHTSALFMATLHLHSPFLFFWLFYVFWFLSFCLVLSCFGFDYLVEALCISLSLL